jgi:hypothetical protein
MDAMSTRGLLTVVLLAVAGAVAVPAPAGAVGATVLVVAASGRDSTDTKTAVAECPPGLPFVQGTGGRTDSDGADVVLTAVRPNGGLSSVTARGEEAIPSSGNWAVLAYALCGPPLPGLLRVVDGVGTGPASPKTAVTQCPAGSTVLATGFELTGAATAVLPTAVRPAKGLTEVSVTGYASTAARGDWGLAAIAICTTPIPGTVVVSATGPSTSDTPQSISVFCPPGTTMHGIGGSVNGGEGSTVLNGLSPGRLTLGGTGTGEGFWWYWYYYYSVTTTVICAP